jgi:hypothetical protein
MLAQQHPDGLPANACHELTPHRRLGDQPHAPASLPFGRWAADHGHDALRLPRAERRLPSRPRLLLERPVEPLLDIAPAEVAHRLRAHPHGLGHLGRTRTLIQQA